MGGDDWRGGRARDGDERDRGDCGAVRRRGRRDCVVVGRSRAAAERAHRQALAEDDPGGPGRRSRSRGALLFVVLHRAPQPCSNRSVRRAPISIAGSIHPATLSPGTTTCNCSRTPRPAASAGARDWSSRSRLSARSRPGSVRTALLPAPVSGRATSLATSSLPAVFFRRFPTRRPGTCCRSMPARSRSPGSGSRRS